MTPERRAELLEELALLAIAEAETEVWERGESCRRELDEAEDPEPDSGTTLGLEARGGAR